MGEGHSSAHVKKRSFASEIATNVCKFVCGETVRGLSSGVSDHEGGAPVSVADPKEMAIALEHQQNRAEVCTYMHIDRKQMIIEVTLCSVKCVRNSVFPQWSLVYYDYEIKLFELNM